MKISYAITVCNEKKEVKRLVDFLLFYKRPIDEIVVLYDQKNGDDAVIRMLTKMNKLPNFQVWRGFFDNDFAAWKNKLKDYCKGDYIFQIDADEIPNKALIKNLPTILTSNPDNEVYLVPRVNTVKGLTQEHVDRWRWNVSDKGWINWPDYQWRIWKNKSEIIWKNRVHEKLDGFKTYSLFPAQEELALYHPKDIERQEKQNAYYDTL